MKHLISRNLAVALAVAAAAASHAGIISADTSNTVVVNDPAGMKYTARPFQSTDGKVRVWSERQGVRLATDLTVDATETGTYDAIADLATSTIGEGTVIDSHYLAFDPVGIGSASATIGFSGKILGVIVTSDRLSGDRLFASDGLALASVPSSNLPSSHYALRGLDMRLTNFGLKLDWFTINADNSITVNLDAINPGDGMRIVTEAVPEPTSMAALGLGALGLLRRRKGAKR